jgi:hypothetical protein
MKAKTSSARARWRALRQRLLPGFAGAKRKRFDQALATLDAGKTRGRVDGLHYVELPDEQRTAILVGMLDMLDRLAEYFGTKERAAFNPMLQYASGFDSDDLREQFDAYLADNPEGMPSAIASNFLSMLIEKSGALHERTMWEFQTELLPYHGTAALDKNFIELRAARR